MKRFVLILLAVAAAVALLARPAPAADFKFGGFFKQSFYYTDNLRDGNDDVNDNMKAFYMRMRLYFNAIASENLMAVCKVELDDVWGQGRIGRVSVDGGSNGRSDEATAAENQGSANSGFEIKNAYIQFNLPNTPLTFQAGALPILLGYGLAFNDDTNGIVAIGKFDPIKVTLAYSKLQDNALTALNLDTASPYINEVLRPAVGATTPATLYVGRDDWDLWALDLRFAPTKEFALGLAGTWVNAEPNNVAVTLGGVTTTEEVKTNLYNLVLDADYKAEAFSIYFTGGKNFGDVKIAGESLDYQGYILSLGGTVNVQPVVIGVDFYYASGDKRDGSSNSTDDYVTPGRDGRYTNMIDEVVFPGMFDDDGPTVRSDLASSNATNVRGTGLTASNAQYTPVNIWAVGAHVDFKPLDKTLLQAGAAYMGFVENVLANAATGKEDDTLGTSLYIRLTQGIVDGLQLKASFGYLVADDGFTSNDKDDDAYKFGAGLFWSW